MIIKILYWYSTKKSHMVPLKNRDRESMPIYQTKSKSEVISTSWLKDRMTSKFNDKYDTKTAGVKEILKL